MFVVNGIPIDYVLVIIGGLMMFSFFVIKNAKILLIGIIIFGIGFILAGIAVLVPYIV